MRQKNYNPCTTHINPGAIKSYIVIQGGCMMFGRLLTAASSLKFISTYRHLATVQTSDQKRISHPVLVHIWSHESADSVIPWCHIVRHPKSGIIRLVIVLNIGRIYQLKFRATFFLCDYFYRSHKYINKCFWAICMHALMWQTTKSI